MYVQEYTLRAVVERDIGVCVIPMDCVALMKMETA